MKNRMKRIVMLTVLIGLLAMEAITAFAHAEKAFYLKGQLGKKEIAVKMICYDETPALRYVQYFFNDDKRDRYMAGKLVDGYWQFAADIQENNNYPKPEGVLLVASNGTNWQGSWTENGGKKQTILLTPIAADLVLPQFRQLPLMKELDPYERYRLATIHFEKKPVPKTSGNSQAIWYVEKASGISFFRLAAGNRATNLKPVNSSLERIHLSLVQQYFTYSPQKTGVIPETKLLYLTSELVSFQVASPKRFLGLVSMQVQLSTTLNVSTGETLQLEDIIWLDKKNPKPPASDFFSLFQYRKKVMAPQIFQWLQELYPQQMKTEHCGTNKAESWNLPAWNLTGKGLALGLNSTDDCGTFQWAIIPYEKLQPFIAKQYHLPNEK